MHLIVCVLNSVILDNVHVTIAANKVNDCSSPQEAGRREKDFQYFVDVVLHFDLPNVPWKRI